MRNIRKRVDNLSLDLTEEGVPCLFFHGKGDDAAVTGHCSAKDIGFWLESMARHDSRFANVLKKVVEKI